MWILGLALYIYERIKYEDVNKYLGIEDKGLEHPSSVHQTNTSLTLHYLSIMYIVPNKI